MSTAPKIRVKLKRIEPNTVEQNRSEAAAIETNTPKNSQLKKGVIISLLALLTLGLAYIVLNSASNTQSDDFEVVIGANASTIVGATIKHYYPESCGECMLLDNSDAFYITNLTKEYWMELHHKGITDEGYYEVTIKEEYLSPTSKINEVIFTDFDY